MPRGQRKSLDEKLAAIDEQIAALTAEKKALLAQKDQEAIAQLIEAAKAAGKTPAELVAELTNQK